MVVYIQGKISPLNESAVQCKNIAIAVRLVLVRCGSAVSWSGCDKRKYVNSQKDMENETLSILAPHFFFFNIFKDTISVQTWLENNFLLAN